LEEHFATNEEVGDSNSSSRTRFCSNAARVV
jgi:hypothetical protein